MDIEDQHGQETGAGDMEQRFSLAISLQNLKQNKYFLVFVLLLVTVSGFYLGVPIAVIEKTAFSQGGSFNYLTQLYDAPLTTLNASTEYTPESNVERSKQVAWGFPPTVRPTPCLEDHVTSLGMGVYLSVCNYKGNIIVDVRKFTGNSKVGITPTIVGIGLNVNQWNVIIDHVSIINRYIQDLS